MGPEVFLNLLQNAENAAVHSFLPSQAEGNQ